MTERINLCDVAKENLLPWLSGRLDGTPEGQTFEEHVRECKSCSALVADRRQAMQALLALADESNRVEREEPQQAATTRLQPPSWRALLQSKGTAILTAAAALLLVASYLTKPSEGLLGEKALPPVVNGDKDEAAPQATETETAETAHKATAAHPQAPSEGALEKQPDRKQPTEVLQKQEASEAPKRATQHKPAARKPASRRRSAAPTVGTQPTPKTDPNTGTVEVYDESGRLVGSATTGGQK